MKFPLVDRALLAIRKDHARIELEQFYLPIRGGVPNPSYGDRALAKTICLKWGLIPDRHVGGYTGRLDELREWVGMEMANYPIEADVPIPHPDMTRERDTAQGPRCMYPFDELDIGDSFIATTKLKSRCTAASARYNKTFIYRRITDGTIRIWRTA